MRFEVDVPHISKLVLYGPHGGPSASSHMRSNSVRWYTAEPLRVYFFRKHIQLVFIVVFHNALLVHLRAIEFSDKVDVLPGVADTSNASWCINSMKYQLKNRAGISNSILNSTRSASCRSRQSVTGNLRD